VICLPAAKQALETSSVSSISIFIGSCPSWVRAPRSRVRFLQSGRGLARRGRETIARRVEPPRGRRALTACHEPTHEEVAARGRGGGARRRRAPGRARLAAPPRSQRAAPPVPGRWSPRRRPRPQLRGAVWSTSATWSRSAAPSAATSRLAKTTRAGRGRDSERRQCAPG
jgi:hypothetical protein